MEEEREIVGLRTPGGHHPQNQLSRAHGGPEAVCVRSSAYILWLLAWCFGVVSSRIVAQMPFICSGPRGRYPVLSLESRVIHMAHTLASLSPLGISVFPSVVLPCQFPALCRAWAASGGFAFVPCCGHGRVRRCLGGSCGEPVVFGVRCATLSSFCEVPQTS